MSLLNYAWDMLIQIRKSLTSAPENKIFNVNKTSSVWAAANKALKRKRKQNIKQIMNTQIKLQTDFWVNLMPSTTHTLQWWQS